MIQSRSRSHKPQAYQVRKVSRHQSIGASASGKADLRIRPRAIPAGPSIAPRLLTEGKILAGACLCAFLADRKFSVPFTSRDDKSKGPIN